MRPQGVVESAAQGARGPLYVEAQTAIPHHDRRCKRKLRGPCERVLVRGVAIRGPHERVLVRGAALFICDGGT